MAQNIFYRNCRIFSDNRYSEGGRWKYIIHQDYAKSPQHYIRAFLLIQKDLQTLFEYVEPSDLNVKTYSYRVHELLVRTCIELEANFKAILSENTYSKSMSKCNIKDYEKVNRTHKLSAFEVKMPSWHGMNNIYAPFEAWAKSSNLLWFKAFNDSKHDRYNAFKEANLINLVNAVAGLLVLLSAQFHTEEFSSSSYYLSVGDNDPDNMETAIGSFFRIKFPPAEAWTEDEKYSLSAKDIVEGNYVFAKFDYDSIQ